MSDIPFPICGRCGDFVAHKTRHLPVGVNEYTIKDTDVEELGLVLESKKQQILALYEQGTTDIAEIVRKVKARPSYVARVLQHAGYLDGDFDLYTTIGREQNVYTRYFRNDLTFRNVEAARESIATIDRLFLYFERLGDRAGQHQAMALALLGRNRATWAGKSEEGEIFAEWLRAHI